MNIEKIYQIFPNPTISLEVEQGTPISPRPKVSENDIVSINISWSIIGIGPSSHAAMLHIEHQIKACIARAEEAFTQLEESK